MLTLLFMKMFNGEVDFCSGCKIGFTSVHEDSIVGYLWRDGDEDMKQEIEEKVKAN